MKVYNKLIRDKIPQVMTEKGVSYDVRVMTDSEYADMLNVKLQEEMKEYLDAEGKDQIEELADLVEVIYAIVRNNGSTVEQLEAIRQQKAAERGGFQEKLLLISTE